jgi:hypothetical protein
MFFYVFVAEISQKTQKWTKLDWLLELVIVPIYIATGSWSITMWKLFDELSAHE